MKIIQLLSGIITPITNEEHQFISGHRNNVKIHSLNERDQWLAQNLVRKGLYTISKDSNILIKNTNDSDI
jgi:hypothetical protein